jgi:tight adherence protein B
MLKELSSLFVLYKTGVIVVTSVVIFLIFLINSRKAVSFLDRKFEAQADWLIKELDTLFIEINKKTAVIGVYASTLGVGFIIFILFLPNVIPGILIGGALGFMSSRMISPVILMLKERRAATFNLQMVDALTLMSNGLRSGLNLIQAVELVIAEMPNPIRQEFTLLLAQNRVGVPIDEAFVNLSKRLNVDDLDMFATAILILRETGGNLAETFDTIAYTIRERVKLTAKVKALTAQGVMQAIVITVIPFGLMFFQYMSNPTHTKLFFSTPLGYILISLMLLLQGIGGFMIKKIVTIDV